MAILYFYKNGVDIMSFIVQISPFVHLFTLKIVFRWGGGFALNPPPGFCPGPARGYIFKYIDSRDIWYPENIFITQIIFGVFYDKRHSLSSSCAPCVASFPGLSILDCPSVFSNVLITWHVWSLLCSSWFSQWSISSDSSFE
jgi:hypothetical protein